MGTGDDRDDRDDDRNATPPPTPGAPPRVNLQIQAEEAVTRGVYSNSALVNLNENEFTLDFIYIPPQSPVAHLRSRIIVSPRQAKLLLRVLGESVARYEQRFGPISEPQRKDPILH